MPKEQTEAEFLQSYDAGDYPRPSVTVDMVIFTIADKEQPKRRKLPEKELKVLLIKRKGHPFKDCWALPGGFVHPTENLEQAAERELGEETGLENIYLEQLYTWSEPGRDPRTWVISCSYLALIDADKVLLKAGDDAADAQWFSVEKTGKRDKITVPGKLAFDHEKIIFYALERLRNKIESTDVVFNLLPEKFALPDLQRVFETILGKKLFAANFRRKIGNKITATKSFTEGKRFRPSRLFRRKKKK